MIILIDGYNVLKTSDQEVSDQERKAFLHRLARYARRKKHTIIVVFDGGQDPWPTTQKHASIGVVFSGWKQTADEYIITYFSMHQGEIILVSSDNELGHTASQHNVPSIGAEDFLSLMQEALQEGDLVEDQEVSVILEDDAQDLDTLMQQASKEVPLKKEDTAPSDIKSKKSHIARRDKKLYSILKKL